MAGSASLASWWAAVGSTDSTGSRTPLPATVPSAPDKRARLAACSIARLERDADCRFAAAAGCWGVLLCVPSRRPKAKICASHPLQLSILIFRGKSRLSLFDGHVHETCPP